MRAVLDTNIVISRYLTPSGPPGRVFEAARTDRYDMVVSDDLLDEYRGTFFKPRIIALHKMGITEIEDIISDIRSIAKIVVPVPPFATAAPDPDDNIVLDCAVAGQADYIVTGDRRLREMGQYEGVRIVTPAEFLAILEGRT